METNQIGYLEFNDCFYHFPTARCAFVRGRLEVEAEGRTYRLKIYEIPFKGIDNISQLAAKTFETFSQEETIASIGEGGILFEDSYLTWQTISVRCGQFNAEDNTLFLMIKGTIGDNESGEGGPVDGTLICEVHERLW